VVDGQKGSGLIVGAAGSVDLVFELSPAFAGKVGSERFRQCVVESVDASYGESQCQVDAVEPAPHATAPAST
jgi:hypothetical protein